ncbi:MAG: hypothetical protein C0512_11505 [Flavobacterium sp.]|nr:hypothetical protein [Flavobacterium sp.]
MDFLDIIINFFNVTDSSSLFKKNWTIIFDRDEYLGERIKSFFIFVMLILAYIFIFVFVIYLINYIFQIKNKQNQ